MNLFSITMFGKWVNPTMSDHPCDLCEETIPQGTRAHYVNGRVNEFEYVAGWQHIACWDAFTRGSETTRKASIPLLISKLLEPRPE